MDLLDIEITTDTDDDEGERLPPRIFGFHGSGAGVIELCDDRMLDTSDQAKG